jgi:Phage terminase, small subunit
MAAHAPPELKTEKARRFWHAVCKDWPEVGDSPDARELLARSCQVIDRREAAQRLLDEEGLTFTDRLGTPRPHPVVAIVRDLDVLQARLLRELRLAPDDGLRPPRLQ